VFKAGSSIHAPYHGCANRSNEKPSGDLEVIDDYSFESLVEE
jgi:hypothetical protein